MMTSVFITTNEEPRPLTSSRHPVGLVELFPFNSLKPVLFLFGSCDELNQGMTKFKNLWGGTLLSADRQMLSRCGDSPGAGAAAAAALTAAVALVRPATPGARPAEKPPQVTFLELSLRAALRTSTQTRL